jgi:uncharacterized protein with FMN-binding domain
MYGILSLGHATFYLFCSYYNSTPMKKFLLSFLVFFASAGYVVYQYVGGSPASASVSPAGTSAQNTQIVVSTTQTNVTQSAPSPAPATPTPPTSTPVSTQTPTPTPTPTPVPAPTPAPKPAGLYADGTYTGTSADAYYGTVQIQAVIQNGKLAAVNFLQYPSDRSTSRYINSQAMPQLKSEAIAAQSANVSGVSGATDTSQAFRQSLGDALTQAKNS